MMDGTSTELAPGVSIREVVTYTSVEDLRDLLVSATNEGRTVVPFGGKHSLSTGNPAPIADWGVDLRPNSGIISYEPADLTISVRAGTTWQELQAALGANGQELPVDVAHPETATVGGVVATGFAGARRFRQGTLRDLLIGCGFVRGDGMIAKAGGMVVKNVSGFEIPRFLHGSWGSLAVLDSVNLKVMPKPRAEMTVVVNIDSLDEALTLGGTIAQASLPIDSIVVNTSPMGVTLSVRATGRERAVSETLTTLFPNIASTDRLVQDESTAWWQAITNSFAETPDDLLVALTAPLAQLSALSSELEQAIPDGSLLLQPGLGSVRVRVPLDALARPELTLAIIPEIASRFSASYTVESAPHHLRDTIPAWGVVDSGSETMLAIKQQFDAGGILNPGRLFL